MWICINIFLGDMAVSKILFDWLRTFWPKSQELKFSQIRDLCRNTANNINFHYRTTSVKCNDQINSKSPVFDPFLVHFSNFLGIFFFFFFLCGKSGSVMHSFISISSTMPKFRKTTIPRKHLDRQTDGRINRTADRPYFIGPLQLPMAVKKLYLH